jgi:hypothetical protein
MVGADRELAVPAVDEYGEPDRRGPAEVVHRVQRGPDRAAGEEHVVDEDHDLAVDPAWWHLGVVGAAGRVLAEVVAVHRDVERADRDLGPLDLRDPLADPAREVYTAGRDAEQHQVIEALVALEDLVGDAGQCPGDVTGVQDGSSLGEGGCLGSRCVGRGVRRHHQIRTSFSASQDGSLKDVDRGRQ